MGWLELLLACAAGFSALLVYIKRFHPWLFADVVFIHTMASSINKRIDLKKKNIRLCDKLQILASDHPSRKFIMFEDSTWTYKQMDVWANKCAYAFDSIGIQHGDKIALMMFNEPAFIANWMGSARRGAVTAFINTNLKHKALLYSIKMAEAKVLLIGNDEVLLEAVKDIEEELRLNDVKLYVYGKKTDNFLSFSEILEKQSGEFVPPEWKESSRFLDTVCYIYTSGTTGLPKAVNVNNEKCWAAGLLLVISKATPEDVIYTPLPLYHTAAALLGFGGALMTGCTLVLRKKFSASQLWPDCRKYGVTIVQYIGETMRYVCKQPATPEDRDHKVRLLIGNGLRPNVWRTILDRYGADIHVMEFYAATEGNFGFFNVFNKFGCIGTFGPLYQAISYGAIIKYNTETDEIVKDKNESAICVGCNEPGLVVSRIDKKHPFSPYTGNKALTERKILRDVFKKGDTYFNSGDLLSIDEDYGVHFCDRIGDTFRWKGENVSTNEVTDILTQAEGVKLAAVYGVEIKDTEGRAGMASIVLESSEFDYNTFYDYVCEHLAPYARPIFIRIVVDLELTGTLKMRKGNLKTQGWDRTKFTEPLYFLDMSAKSYVPVTDQLQRDIEDGTLRI